MANQFVLFTTLIAYSVVVSQSFMYILSLRNAQLNLDAIPYLLLRKQIDKGMQATFRYAMYSALIANLTLVIMHLSEPAGLRFITVSISLIALIIDTLITIKGNLPINRIINSWSTDNYPENWFAYRTKWLIFFQYRQIVNITGFIGLLIGAVFK